MTSRPTQGSSTGSWGTQLNNWLDENLAPVYNVKGAAYGAAGDGVTDDSSAISAAVTAARSSGGIVYFPAGSYVLSNLPLYGNIWYRGAGRGATYLYQKSGATSALASPGDTTTQAQNLVVSDMTLTGFNNQSTNAGGLQTSNMIAPVIERVGFTYMNTFGMQVLGCGTAGNDMYGVIRDCYFQQLLTTCVAVYLKASAASNADGWTVENNVVNAATTSNVFLKIDAVSTGSGGRGYGADAVWCHGNRTIGLIQLYDLTGTQGKIHGNRHENNLAGSNLQVDTRAGSGGNTGPYQFMGNTYAISGGAGTLTFNDNANIPSVRVDDPVGAAIYDGALTDNRSPYRWLTVGSGGTCPNGQLVPGFQNSWVYGGSSRHQPGFWKDHYGTVYLRGRLTSGTASASMFTLPTGYRPGSHCDFGQPAGLGSTGALTITSAGSVTAPSGAGATVSLDGISFRVPMS